MQQEEHGLDATSASHGRLEWIGIRPRQSVAMRVVGEADLSTSDGVVGDYFGGDTQSPRQVTLIQFEALGEIAAALDRADLPPALTRRNMAVSGIKLDDLIGHEFTIGEAVLLATGDCPPCQRMDETLGAGGRVAMKGRGGITARVIQPGRVQIGDRVCRRTIMDGTSEV